MSEPKYASCLAKRGDYRRPDKSSAISVVEMHLRTAFGWLLPNRCHFPSGIVGIARSFKRLIIIILAYARPFVTSSLSLSLSLSLQ